MTMPTLFVAHGAPPLLDDAAWMAQLRAWGAALPRPTAIVMVSAHWESLPVAVGATRPVPLVYDFAGFPPHYYRLVYPSPGAPKVAARVHALLHDVGIRTIDVPDRGLDHGTYVPLMAMVPAADVPVLQVSLPRLDPRAAFAMGEALAPLRQEGVWIVGSGFLTHNLRMAFSPEPGVPSALTEFDSWVADSLTKHDVDALVDFEARAPAAKIAHPRTEHYLPLLVALGASGASRATFPITGWWMKMSKRSVQFGPASE